jgi:hypothetical protein
MRPEFELDHIRRYITYHQQFPSKWDGTVPALQAISQDSTP